IALEGLYFALDGPGQTARADLDGTNANVVNGYHLLAFSATTNRIAGTSGDKRIVTLERTNGNYADESPIFGTPFDITARGDDIFWTESDAQSIWRGKVTNVATDNLSANEPGCESISAGPTVLYWAGFDPAGGYIHGYAGTIATVVEHLTDK